MYDLRLNEVFFRFLRKTEIEHWRFIVIAFQQYFVKSWYLTGSNRGEWPVNRHWNDKTEIFYCSNFFKIPFKRVRF